MLPLAAVSALLLATSPEGWPGPRESVWSAAVGGGISHTLGNSIPGLESVEPRLSWTYQAGSRTALEIELTPVFVLFGEGDGTLFGPGFSILGRFFLTEGASARLGLDAGVGMLFFDRPVPSAGTAANYTVKIGAFYEQLLAPGRSFVLGYRLHHISNGGRGDVNPGINTSQLYLGLRLWSQSPGSGGAAEDALR